MKLHTLLLVFISLLMSTEGCYLVRFPVCGTNGKTYHNDCYLKVDNSKLLQNSPDAEPIRVKYLGECGNPRVFPKGEDNF